MTGRRKPDDNRSHYVDILLVATNRLRAPVVSHRMDRVALDTLTRLRTLSGPAITDS